MAQDPGVVPDAVLRMSLAAIGAGTRLVFCVLAPSFLVSCGGDPNARAEYSGPDGKYPRQLPRIRSGHD